jgi:acetoacetate decarboxylase
MQAVTVPGRGWRVFPRLDEGPASLDLMPHALAPVAALPVREIVSGAHILTALTLGLGTVVYDYLDARKNAP